MLDDEYDKLGSDSGSFGTYFFCAFSLRFENSVGSVSVYGLTFLHQQESISKVVDSLHYSGDQIPDFPFKFQNQFYTYSLTLCSIRL